MSQIIVHPPMIITARLMPGIKIADVFISLEAVDRDADRRVVYRYHFDGAVSHSKSDLKSGCGAPVDYRKAMGDLLAFLGAAADDPTNRNFPKKVREWAKANDDEIGLLKFEIEEGPQ